MKLSGLILVFLLLFTLIFGSCPSKTLPPPPQDNSHLEAVTLELIREIINSGIDYQQLNYYLSSGIILFTNELANIDIIDNGILVRTNQISSNQINIGMNEIGRIISTITPNSEKISIYFGNKNVILEFTRNININRYEFSSAKQNNVEYVIRNEYRPYLNIRSDDRRSSQNLQLQGFQN